MGWEKRSDGTWDCGNGRLVRPRRRLQDRKRAGRPGPTPRSWEFSTNGGESWQAVDTLEEAWLAATQPWWRASA